MFPLPEVTTFQMRIFRRILFFFYILFSGSLVVGSLYALISFNYSQQSIWVIVVFILMIAGAMAMGVYVTWDSLEIFSGKLTLLSDRMVYKSLIRQSTILYSEIRGFQARFPASNTGSFIPKEVIAIVPSQDTTNRKIKVSPFINDHEVLLEWLRKNFNELLGRYYVDN